MSLHLVGQRLAGAGAGHGGQQDAELFGCAPDMDGEVDAVLFPATSVAVQLTVVSPIANSVPESGAQTVVAIPELSGSVGANGVGDVRPPGWSRRP